MQSRTVLQLAVVAVSALVTVLTLLAAPVAAAPVRPPIDIAAWNVATKPNTCAGEVWQGLWMTDWHVNVVNDTIYNPSECGNGCLDNLRGRCGWITQWICERNAKSAYYHFHSTRWCTAYDITQAILACTKGEQNIGCMTTDMHHGGQGITDVKDKKKGKNGI